MIGFLAKYARHHRLVFGATLAQIVQAPVASLMTIAAIGITLALPTGLYVLVENLQRAAAGWDKGGQISLFLKRDAAESAIEKFADRLRRTRGVASVDYVSRQQALAEFKRLSGFGDVLSALDRNPLPAVLIVQPTTTVSADGLQALVQDLKGHELVDDALLDLEWVRRLNALLVLAERAVWALAALLALAVLLTIGNTIRLAVMNRRDEIEVMKLMGGTNAFIRRPFLYSGVLQGMLGAVVTWLILAVTQIFLSGPLTELGAAYGAEFFLRGMTLRETGFLLLVGALLGWLGSRLAVGRHLSTIEPS